LLCLITFCKWWTEEVKNLVKQSDTYPSIIGTELIDGGKREKWSRGLITARDEMKRVARDETVAIREKHPLAYCCNNGEWCGEEMGKIEDVTPEPLRNYGEGTNGVNASCRIACT
jgi:hypothetical protein